jgi:hypothetical protein
MEEDLNRPMDEELDNFRVLSDIPVDWPKRHVPALPGREFQI